MIEGAKLRELHEAIQEQKDKFLQASEIFGPGDRMTSRALARLEGLEQAFKIVSGRDWLDYWIEEINREEAEK